jgi:endonuclease YncB( thermonuclease family)
MRESIVRRALRQLACLAFAGTLALPLYLVSPSNLTAKTVRIIGEIKGFPRIIDGDTIVIDEVRIRLEGIDAPETTQTCNGATMPEFRPGLGRPSMLGKPEPDRGTWACGIAATRHLIHLIGKAEVRCDDLGPDKYNRTLGRCFVGSTNLNARMVQDGFAWAFVKYSTSYVDLEAAARLARLGIWQGETIPAWEFRQRAWQVAEQQSPDGCTIKGNISTSGKVYHMPWSVWYDKVRMVATTTGIAGGKRWFCSEADAIAAGWRPAQTR